MLNRIKLQLVLALFWFGSAYFAMGAVVPWQWAWRCAWLNLIIGMAGLLLVTGTKDGDRIFYLGPEGDRPGLIQVGFLWALPIVGFIIAGLWWLLRLIGIYNW